MEWAITSRSGPTASPPRPNSPVTPQIHALLDKAIARALLGQQSPEAALDSVKADGDKLLGK
jgi:ABC-type glycerol-3-phosphate transport system substrate-binding protein